MMNYATTTQKITKPNQSSDKLLTILEYLSTCSEPVRLQDIADNVNLNASTVLRFVTALEQNGYVIQDSYTQKYSMTMKICSLANKMVANLNNKIHDMGRPLLRSLSRIFEESTCLAVEKEMSVVYIDVQDGPDHLLSSMQYIGKMAPMHCTGVGKLLLLNYTEVEIDKYIAIKGLPRFTKNTLCTKESLLKELEIIRKQGYAFDDEECEIGAKCLAVPVYDYRGKVIACLSVTGSIFRMTPEKIYKNLPYMLDAAAQLSTMMGYDTKTF